MSDFFVKVCRLETVLPHPDSQVERLALAKLTTSEYRFVVQKNVYQPGDLVVYFPLDSVLPDSIVETLGLTGKLAGKEHNRVKTVRLRGEISQGLVASLSDVLTADEVTSVHEGDDLTERLGVTKYEPPAVLEKYGNLHRLPDLVAKYDIENAENYPAQLARLLAIRVMITEKLEGSHWGLSIDAEGQIDVLQRNFTIVPTADGEHTWHAIARLSGLRDKLPIVKVAAEEALGHTIGRFTIRGELVGPRIQSNIYGLLQYEVYLFEMEADGKPIDATTFLTIARVYDLPLVPVLAEDILLSEWLVGRSIRDASNGNTVLTSKPVLREGVVIKPMVEQDDPDLGRLFLKQRSPVYLAAQKD